MSGGWTEPPWASALDEAACIRAIPADATMTGMFLESASPWFALPV